MSSIGKHRTTHRIDIEAPADTVYGIVADAQNWPQHFAPTIHVEREALTGSDERLHIWATANGEVKSWTSRRSLDPRERRVTFRQEKSAHPVAGMGGEWIAEPTDTGTRLTLHHDFDVVDDAPEHVEWVTQATNRNSEAELANIRTLAEQHERSRDLVFRFDDEVLVDGPLDAAYEFVRAADLWETRLPQVARMDMREDVENVQWMTMETKSPDGSTHTTESVRICLPLDRIMYKQVVTPALMDAHIGEWAFEQTADGVRVVSRHTVAINEAAIEPILGPGSSIADAQALIRRAAGGNSATTLKLAKEFAEARND